MIKILKNGDIKSSRFTSLYQLSDNSLWVPVFYHNNHSGKVLFSSESEFLSTNTPDKYSILGLLHNGGFKNSSGKYEFLLRYPTMDPTHYNRWYQNNDPYSAISGYSAITINWGDENWGGLAPSSDSSMTFVDGSPNTDGWFYAIGSRHVWVDKGIPGYSTSTELETDVCLYVRYDTLGNKSQVRFLKSDNSIIAHDFIEI